jgi:hypothetical protein
MLCCCSVADVAAYQSTRDALLLLCCSVSINSRCSVAALLQMLQRINQLAMLCCCSVAAAAYQSTRHALLLLCCRCCSVSINSRCSVSSTTLPYNTREEKRTRNNVSNRRLLHLVNNIRISVCGLSDTTTATATATDTPHTHTTHTHHTHTPHTHTHRSG